MTDLTMVEGPEAFFSPCHKIDMQLLSHGQEPMRGETYGIWQCPKCDQQWFESEFEEQWTPWDEDE